MSEYQTNAAPQGYRQEPFSFESKVRSTLSVHQMESTQPIWMNDNVMRLGIDIDARRIPCDPTQWGAWMANVMMDTVGGVVKFRFPNQFRRHYAVEKLGAAIGSFYKGNKVEFLVNGR